MMRLGRLTLLGAAAALADTAGARPAPLFADPSVLQLAIKGPVAAVARNRSDNAPPQPAVLQSGAEALPITLAARGITRRRPDICQFPPLRVTFSRPPPAESPFAGQRRLKLVTHCRDAATFQNHILLEYAAYRMLNAITSLSFRVRLASIDYLRPDGRAMVSRYGFFIEDARDLARRNGLSGASTGDRVAAAALSPAESARAALFQYMIGNLDWSMRAGPEGEGCCHNFRLFAAPGSSLLRPAPYDFDFAGLVDAPYAVPPDGMRARTVRERRYRGYCAHNGEALAAAREYRAKRPQLLAALAEVPLDGRIRRKAVSYLQRFFTEIADDAATTTHLLKECVR